MKKNLLLTCLSLFLTMASFAQVGMIWGTSSVCVGSTGVVFDTSYGSAPGFWSSSNITVATITPGGSTGPAMATVTGVSAGTTTITFTDGTFSAYMTYTVNVAPGTISASFLSICPGATSTFTNSVAGGTWASSTPAIATINPATGIATGISPGVANIIYTLGSGCNAVTTLTVSPGTSIHPIAGPSTVCVGSTITLSDSTSGGVWTTATGGIATVSSTGVVTGVSGGTSIISYTTSGSCGSATVTYAVTVPTTTSAGSISGPSTVVAGSTIVLSASVPGGTWSSSSTSIASVSSGSVLGVAAGSATITYSVTGCGGPAFTTAGVTVTAFGGISGDVLFTGAPYYGTVKVWLITYDATTHMLAAIDSTVVMCGGSSVYYQFSTAPTDNYRIKAATDTTTATFGYVPTYHTSSFSWSTATVLAHTSGVADINQDITMGTGTPTSGPGFIAGDVTLGANKGTSGSYAVGLKVYLLNATGTTVLQQATTDASGHYSFSNLPVGANYQIHPEDGGFATTNLAVTLTASAPSVTAASFTQHTISFTITPNTAAVRTVTGTASSVNVFPNPSNGKLNVEWNAIAAEKGTITVTDITGRIVVKTSVDINEGAGMKSLDLSGLTNGIYMINVKSANINYNGKIQITQ